MESDDCKVLIIAESPFCFSNGVGVTLTNLFQKWPKENIAIFYTQNISSENEVCPKERSVYADIHSQEQGRRKSFIPYMLGNKPAWQGLYSKRWLFKKLNHYKPTLLYTMVWSYHTLRYSNWVARTLNIPYVVHVADDGIAQGPFSVTLSLLRSATHRFVISENMQEEYLKRYGLTSDVLHNGVVDELSVTFPKVLQKQQEITVRYVGTLWRHVNFNAIEDIAEAVRIFNETRGKARFEIYGGEYTKKLALELADNQFIFYCGFRSVCEQGFMLLKSASLLVIPMTFNKDDSFNYALSFPTKLAECIASGTPTLIYSPYSTAAARYCAQNNLGIVVTERSVNKIVSLLDELYNNPSEKCSKALRDQEFVKRTLSMSVLRKHFQEILIQNCFK